MSCTVPGLPQKKGMINHFWVFSTMKTLKSQNWFDGTSLFIESDSPKEQNLRALLLFCIPCVDLFLITPWDDNIVGLFSTSSPSLHHLSPTRALHCWSDMISTHVSKGWMILAGLKILAPLPGATKQRSHFKCLTLYKRPEENLHCWSTFLFACVCHFDGICIFCRGKGRVGRRL